MNTMMNRSTIVRVSMAMGVLLAACAAIGQYRIRKPRHEVKVYVAGSQVRFDRVKPMNSGRRILVPMRGVFEKMGATVTYDARRHRALARRGKTRVILPLTGRNRSAYVNGETRRLDAYPTLYKGHVLVPIRFVAETLNATVVYSAPKHTVRITPH